MLKINAAPKGRRHELVRAVDNGGLIGVMRRILSARDRRLWTGGEEESRMGVMGTSLLMGDIIGGSVWSICMGLETCRGGLW